MKRTIFGTLAALALVAAAFVAFADEQPQGITAGSTVQDFTLPDLAGRNHSLMQYKDSTAIVVMFIATQCPVSNDYNTRMVELANAYQPRGIQFIGINSNKQESVEECAEHARRNNFPFVVLKDHRNVIADRFGATRTPEVYVIMPDGKVVYHGRIDDSQNISRVESRDLRDALEAILSGNPVPRPVTRAFGCTIKRVS